MSPFPCIFCLTFSRRLGLEILCLKEKIKEGGGKDFLVPPPPVSYLSVLLARTVSHGYFWLQGRLGQLDVLPEAEHVVTLSITRVCSQGRKDACPGNNGPACEADPVLYGRVLLPVLAGAFLPISSVLLPWGRMAYQGHVGLPPMLLLSALTSVPFLRVPQLIRL